MRRRRSFTPPSGLSSVRAFSMCLTAGSLAQAKFTLEGLVVDESRMRRNLDLTQGLIVAEAVMMGLAPHLGRQNAHDIVYAACRELEFCSSGLTILIGLSVVFNLLAWNQHAVCRLVSGRTVSQNE